MPTYAPGSFTKNFGWNLDPPGLHRLHTVIRAGFGGVAESVRRETFRRNCGLTDSNRQLIPINFFLHNTVRGGRNYVTADELVRHAISNPHSGRFDQLALFAMHLARMGSRVGVAGDPRGAAFTNDYVRNRLWHNGGWETDRLNDREVERSFDATVQAQGADTVHKCVTNYVYMMEMVGLTTQPTTFINTHIDEWVGPGLFIAFDRYSIDRSARGGLSKNELVQMTQTDELHKIMGTTEEYLASVAPIFADEWLSLGGMDWVSSPAILDASGTALVSSPVAAPGADTSDSDAPSWSDEDAEDVAAVMRRLQETQAQVRNAQNVRELKTLYKNTCMFCGKQTVIGVDPPKHYSEAAHIKPLGQPHNGPDRKDNMVLLCPEHHLQFDRGLLRIRKRLRSSTITIASKIADDPIDGNALTLRAPHELDDEYVSWHYNFWR